MTETSMHRTTSRDGTPLACRVEGQGPPLVLVHGSLEDGEFGWEEMLPLLRPHFTCYPLNVRNRGRSGQSDDVAEQRRVEDVAALAESIGTGVRVFGESDGGTLALGAAARSPAVGAVAAYEPVVFEVAEQQMLTELEATLARVEEAMSAGRAAEAADAFSGFVANDSEREALRSSGYLDRTAEYMPVLLAELQHDMQSDEPSASDPTNLEHVAVPTLLMNGASSARREWFQHAVQHVAAHVGDAHVRQIAGAGHFGVTLAPEPIADELLPFLLSV